MSQCLLHYGAIAPALDYDEPSRHGLPFDVGFWPVDQDLDVGARTPWQKQGWTAEEGGPVPTKWLNWDDDQRLSCRLMLHAGTNRFSRELIDDSPIALVFGRFPLFAPHVRVKVQVEDENGSSTGIISSDWSDDSPLDFILNPLLVPDWRMTHPDRVVLELESDTACAVFLAAHRWTRAPFPELPGRVVADTRLSTMPVVQISEIADAQVTVERQRAALEGDPGSQTNRLLLGAALERNGDWSVAEPLLRQALSLGRNAWIAGAIVYAQEAERLYTGGDPRGAVQMLVLARVLDPNNLGYALRMAEMLTEIGELDAALAQCRNVFAGAPESPRTAVLLDHIYGQRGDVNGRVAEWRGIAEVHPKAEIPWRRLADALEQAGDRDGAGAARKRAEMNAGKAGS